MSSGFEVRALTVDRNRLKRMRTNEDEEIFTIQVSNTVTAQYVISVRQIQVVLRLMASCRN